MDQRQIRKLHRTLAPILFLPFFLTSITGIIYRLAGSWFGVEKEAREFLMVIHQGEFLGDQLKPIYVFLNGLGLIGMLVTGIVMTGIFKKRPQKSN